MYGASRSSIVVEHRHQATTTMAAAEAAAVVAAQRKGTTMQRRASTLRLSERPSVLPLRKQWRLHALVLFTSSGAAGSRLPSLPHRLVSMWLVSVRLRGTKETSALGYTML